MQKRNAMELDAQDKEIDDVVEANCKTDDESQEGFDSTEQHQDLWAETNQGDDSFDIMSNQMLSVELLAE